MITRGEIMPAGVLNKPHGIRGEISATFYDNVDTDAVTMIIVEQEGLFVPFFVDSRRSRSADTMLLTLDGITNETEAKELASRPFYLCADDPAFIHDDETDGEGLYAADLIGYTALSADGSEIGHIDDIDDTTENVLFIISRPDGSEAMIPIADEFIVDIDTEKSVITMHLPDGLL